MNSENIRLLKAVFFTVVACLVVFAVAVSMFGHNKLWMPEKELPATIPLPVIVDTPSIPATEIATGVSESMSPISTGAELCLQEYQPVCGIDKKTYPNSCIADAQGASIAYEGECKKLTAVSTGSVLVDPKKDSESPVACTQEYAPICGVDNKTYSNTCMAGNVTMAHIGPCDGTEKKVFESGAYQIYSNASIGYGFAMPKYVYYSNVGSQDGSVHSMAIALTATGVEDFASTSVQTWYYKKEPANPPSDTVIKTENGFFYIKNNDPTGSAKVQKIIEVLQESAE